MNLAKSDFLRLDPRYFKAFVAAAQHENFTLAAHQAAMTQSGISQHISKLEEQIGLPLFMRNSKKTVLTNSGKRLLRYIRQYNETVKSLIDEMQDEQNLLEGLVSYAMPPSCLYHPHFPLLLERRSANPGLELKVQLLPNPSILQLIIDGSVDFGCVTERVAHPMLNYQPFCHEEYILVGAPSLNVESVDEKSIVDYQYVHYPCMAVYFNIWRAHSLPLAEHVTDRSLYHGGDINSLDGAIIMAVNGLGLSVFPRHCVQRHLDANQLVEWKSDAVLPCTNTIHLVSKHYPKPSNRVETVIAWLLTMRPIANRP